MMNGWVENKNEQRNRDGVDGGHPTGVKCMIQIKVNSLRSLSKKLTFLILIISEKTSKKNQSAMNIWWSKGYR